MKHRAPFFFRLQVHEVLSVKEAGVVRSIIRTPHLAGAIRYFRKRAKYDSRLVGDPDAFVRARAGGKSTANPQSALIQMGQKFGTDGAAECEVTCNGHHQCACSDCDRATANCPAQGLTISFTDVGHHWVTPFASSVGE